MALSADAAMKLLREAMEGILLPELVSRTVFEALGEYGGELPRRGRDLKSFVEGPLARALDRRVDADARGAVLSRLAPILEAIVQSERPPPPTHSMLASRSGGEDLTTRPHSSGSVPYVLMVSERDAMERRLRLALGGELGASTARTMVDLHAAILARSPRLLVVDATMPPSIPPREIARAVGRAAQDSLTVVWGCDHPFGRDVLAELTATARSNPMGLELAEGVEPLLDLVRSHGTPSPEVPVRSFARPADRPASRPTPRVEDLTPPRRKR